MTDASSSPTTLILASGSPRRSALLCEAGYEFSICVSHIDESKVPADLTAEHLSRYLAEQKARAVAKLHPRAMVLGADTVVAVRVGSPQVAREIILGKPVDLADARRILSLLSGTTHETITGVALLRDSPPFAEIIAVRSTVEMRALTPAELDAYLATNQWQDKAGAYGIQDDDPFVTAIAGDTTNVVGLPMEVTRKLLEKAGINPRLESQRVK